VIVFSTSYEKSERRQRREWLVEFASQAKVTQRGYARYGELNFQSKERWVREGVGGSGWL
jgi:hypothetical protein